MGLSYHFVIYSMVKRWPLDHRTFVQFWDCSTLTTRMVWVCNIWSLFEFKPFGPRDSVFCQAFNVWMIQRGLRYDFYGHLHYTFHDLILFDTIWSGSFFFWIQCWHLWAYTFNAASLKGIILSSAESLMLRCFNSRGSTKKHWMN